MTDETPKPTEPKPKSRRGGARPGAGRPSVAVQMERADKAAETAVQKLTADPDPERALMKILSFYEQQFDLQVARAKFGSTSKAIEAARGVLSTAKELLPFFRPKLSAVAMQAEVQTTTVIRAPYIEESAESWREKYASKPTDPPALPSPVVDQIVEQHERREEDRLRQELKQRELDWQVQHGVSPSPEEWEAAERALTRKLGKH